MTLIKLNRHELAQLIESGWIDTYTSNDEEVSIEVDYT